MPQCAVIGWPGHTGQASAAALSQTVNTKSNSGSPGLVNSSHDFERKPERVVAQAPATAQRLGMELSLGLTSGAVGAEFPRADLVQDRLCDDRACRIAGAEKQDIDRDDQPWRRLRQQQADAALAGAACGTQQAPCFSCAITRVFSPVPSP